MNFLRRRRGSSAENDEPASQVHKSRKPPNTAFRQQRLKAWQPILTPKTVIPMLFLVAAIFAPLGIAIILATYNVENVLVDYTHCAGAGSSYEKIPAKYTSWNLHHNASPDLKWKVASNTDSAGDAVDTCYLQFNLAHDIKPPIYLYYKLTNFYQNHRKYVESYDLQQLAGDAVAADDLTSNCDPLTQRDGKPVYPCGLIANSLFNDTFSDPVLLNTKSGSDNETYELSSSGVSWPSDRKTRFKKTAYAAAHVVPPPNWAKMYPDGYTDDNMPDLSQWEHLQNWMRTAGLPTFYKLYAKNTTETLASGTYEMEIAMHYPVSVFGGTKSVLITTSTVLGGRNMTLGVVYFVVAGLCLACALTFLVQYLVKPRRIGDHNFLQGSTEGNVREQL